MAVIELLTDVVLIVTGFQLLLLAGVLAARMPAGSLRRNLLIAFLLTKAFLVFRWFVLRFDVISAREWPALYLTSCAGFFLLAPLLYLYVQATCRRDFRLQRAHVAHAAPFAAMLAFATVGTVVAFGGGSTGSAALDSFIDRRFWTVFWCGNLIQIVIYIASMFRVLSRYRSGLDEVHLAGARNEIAWMRGLLTVLSLHWIFVTSRSLLALLDLSPPALSGVLDLFSITIFLVFTTVLVVKGLSSVRRIPGFDEAVPTNGAPVSIEDLENCAEKAVALMRTERPYLDPSLGLEELALRLEAPAWQLSRALNTVLGRNFFHFVNGFRVEEAKRRLVDPARADETMLRVLHQSGFNSKSTFNEAFKRETGVTPSEYRRRNSGDERNHGVVAAAVCR